MNKPPNSAATPAYIIEIAPPQTLMPPAQDSVVWTGDNDSEVIDFLDRWHMGDAWRGDGYLYLGRRMVHLSPGDTINRRGPGDWRADVTLT